MPLSIGLTGVVEAPGLFRSNFRSLKPIGSKNMPFYESVFIARQDIPATQVEVLTTSLADIVKAEGGQVTKTEQWGLRTLTLRIKKNKKGHYVLFNIDA